MFDCSATLCEFLCMRDIAECGEKMNEEAATDAYTVEYNVQCNTLALAFLITITK